MTEPASIPTRSARGEKEIDNEKDRPHSLRLLLAVPLGIAVAALVMGVGPYAELSELSAASGGVLDETPRAGAEQAQAHLTAIGERGRELYRSHFWWDLAFLAANALVLFALMNVAGKRAGLGARPALFRLLLALPILGAGFDLLENVAVRELVVGWHDPATIPLRVAFFATWSKLILVSGSVALTLVVLVGWALRARSDRAHALG